jgi:hypothetical protein
MRTETLSQETASLAETEDPLSRILWPKPLKRGDLVVVISPSDGIEPNSNQSWSCTTWKDIEDGEKVLESWGLRVVRRLNERVAGFTAGSPEERRQNLRSAICRNPDAIWIANGGYAAGDVIPVLGEPWVIRWLRQKRPVFVGYSDSSYWNGEMYQKAGLISWNGVHVGGFKDTWDPETIELNKRAVFGENMDIGPGNGWTVIQRGRGGVSEAILLPMNLEAGSRVRWNLPGVKKVIAIEAECEFWSDARRASSCLWNNLGGHKGEVGAIILGQFWDMLHEGESYPDWSRGMTAAKLVGEVIGNRPDVSIVEFKYLQHPQEGKSLRLHPMAMGAKVKFEVMGEVGSDQARLQYLG